MLVTASRDDLKKMMAWFPSKPEAVAWGGTALRFPCTEDTFLIDTKFAELPSLALIDQSGELLGFGQYYAREGRCHLGRLAVDPRRRGSGHGSTLVLLLAQLGLERLGFEECSLFVFESNERAARLYERLGFDHAQYPISGQLQPGTRYMVARGSRLFGG
jgi:ribosomal protein S18 acetylase RimI-like enzyme